MKLGGCVLAGGASRRLGRPKQLVEIGGVPLVRHVASVVLAIIEPTCVVAGAHAGAVSAALEQVDVDLVLAADWEEGMAASVRAAARWARVRGLSALAVFACDQPRLSIEHVRALTAPLATARPGMIVASSYQQTLGVPAVFTGAQLARLEQLRGDQGARTIVRAAHDVVAIDWPDGAFDVDTEADVIAASSR